MKCWKSERTYYFKLVKGNLADGRCVYFKNVIWGSDYSQYFKSFTNPVFHFGKT